VRFDNFCGPSNTSASINISSERTINWIPETADLSYDARGLSGGEKNSRCTLVRTPGLSLFITLPTGPVRGLFPGDGVLYAVGGTHLYQIFYNGTYVDRSTPGFSGASGVGPAGGTVVNDGKPAQLLANGNQLLVISGGYAYCDNGNGPVQCQFSVQLTDLVIDPADPSGKTLTTATGNFFGPSDVGLTIQITGGSGFTPLSQVVASVNGSGEAIGTSAWGTPGSSLGTAIEWLGSVAYTDLQIVGASNVISSALHPFSATNVGQQIQITGGTGFTVGTYVIQSLVLGAGGVPTGKANLNAVVGTIGSTGGTGNLASNYVTASQGTFLDGYFLLFPNPPTKTVYYSAINDGTQWNPLSTFVKAAYPDNVGALQADHEEVLTFGDLQCTEVWQDVGVSNNPFAPNNSYVMHLGCQARWSVTRLGNGVAWIGGDMSRGSRRAYYAVGYNPVQISTPAVESAWATYVTIGDAVAFSYIERGHEFWLINFPTANHTWVYDLKTGWWHERGWWNGASWDRVRAACHAVVYFTSATSEQHFVGDWQNGNVYIMSSALLDDNGTAIYRLRHAQHLTQENLNRFYSKFELDCDTTDAAGMNGTQRLYWNRVGYGRDFIFQLLSWQTATTGVSLEMQYSNDRLQTTVTPGFCSMGASPVTLPVGLDVRIANAYVQFIQGTQ